jgi:hypothetical protein
MFLSPLYANNEYNESDDVEQITVGSVIEPWIWWKLALIDLDIIVGVACIYWLYFILRKVVIRKRAQKLAASEPVDTDQLVTAGATEVVTEAEPIEEGKTNEDEQSEQE